jgi:hypothetical protein
MYTCNAGGTPVAMYANDEVRADDIIGKRSNLGDYIDPAVFHPNSRYAPREETIDFIYTAIMTGRHVTPMNSPPGAYEIYTAAMQQIQSRLATQFIAEPNCRFYPCPSLRPNQRDFIIITGPSGVGKSWLAADYCQSYHFTYPKRKIYLFSAKNSDQALDNLDFVTRLPKSQWTNFFDKDKEVVLEETVEEEGEDKKANNGSDDDDEEETYEEKKRRETREKRRKVVKEKATKLDEFKPIDAYANSLFVFDDIENVTPTELNVSLYAFKAYLTEVGRSSGVDLILCNHMFMRGLRTRDELSECTALVMFPRCSTIYHANRYLMQYVGLPSRTTREILDPKNRWVMLFKDHPMTVISENEVRIVKVMEKN